MNTPPNNDKFSWKAAWIALVVHTLAVFSSTLLAHIRPSADVDMAWSLWFVIDLPISLIVVLFRVFGMELADASAYERMSTVYAAQFASLGGLQYFVLFGWRMGKRKRSPELQPDISHVDSTAILDNPYTAPHAQPSEHA